MKLEPEGSRRLITFILISLFISLLLFIPSIIIPIVPVALLNMCYGVLLVGGGVVGYSACLLVLVHGLYSSGQGL